MSYDTPEKIIQAIREIHAQKLPLNISAVRNSHPDLLAATSTFTPFLGWKQALELAGLNYKSIHTKYIDQIPCLICNDYFTLLNTHLEKIHQVTPQEYCEEFPGADLSSETFRFRSATASSRHPDHLPDWEPASSLEYSFDKLYEYRKRGYQLNYSYMLAIDSPMVIALSKGIEGGWDEVLKIIGINPISHRRVIRDDDFTMKDFVKWLRQRERAGLKNTPNAIHALQQAPEEGPSDLKQRIISWALFSHGRTWSKALDASKVDLSHPAYNDRNFPDEKSLLDAVREIAAAGRPTAFFEVIRHPADSLLSFACAQHFGSWTKALKKAGVKPTVSERPLTSRAEVLVHLKKRIEHGFQIDAVAMWSGSRRDPMLFKAAFRFFPNWRAAIKAASGNDPELIEEAVRDNPFTTKQKVIREFQRLHRENSFGPERKIPRNPHNIYLIAMAHGLFGGWRNAAVAAEIDPKSYHHKNLHPSGQYPTKKSVIQEIQRRVKNEVPVNARALTIGENTDQPLIYGARKLFGTWENALSAAGLNAAKITRKKQDYSIKRVFNQYDTKQCVIAGILKRHKAGLALNARTLHHDPIHRDNPLLRVARKLFGSWDAALEAAGLDPTDIRRKAASE